MSGVVQFQKAGRRLAQRAAPNPLLSEIVDALHYLGGQAHRDAVINCIAIFRRNAGAEPPATLAADVIAACQDHLRSEITPRMVSLPFGPDSRRWVLSTEGAALMAHKTRMI